jgi:hypothetical protein
MVCETEISGAGEAPFPIMKGKKEKRRSSERLCTIICIINISMWGK